ncbi:MAG: type IV pilus biogenesis/stability protein PilW [Candidatus Accumulibacter sp. BA-94]|uniref:tetratricopeptide repeat protein n=1 Tax=Accumulibacter sp. TaxID=2053492 RepID=UPI000449F530|nr:tetratricopeptide repeat protein [Accumulibacter sp.]EXI87910.1 MAG: type IV pilus biogenesis/stability protein PilW [Candidatus Accumulibacter sp. BA-94]MBL8391695.1 tetratricopeptide repeat protein [Accumulibacter sp.]HRD87024.1 tetratricopeptide repeat protein [Accumulibacter sp.]
MTTNALIENLEKLLGSPRDGALLRYSLGSEHLKAGDWAQASLRLREAVERDGNHSAAWKLLGRALAEGNQLAEALAAYEQGIVVAQRRGDVQAVKEMRVFVRRLRRQVAATDERAATASPP